MHKPFYVFLAFSSFKILLSCDAGGNQPPAAQRAHSAPPAPLVRPGTPWTDGPSPSKAATSAIRRKSADRKRAQEIAHRALKALREQRQEDAELAQLISKTTLTPSSENN